MVKSKEIRDLWSRFEAAKLSHGGEECWSARDLQQLFGYSEWKSFQVVVRKAKESLASAGVDASLHFFDGQKIDDIAAGSKGTDVLMTRPAAYAVTLSADGSRYEAVAFAKAYFSAQTRRIELVEQKLLFTERLDAREKLAQTEKDFGAVLYERGVTSNQDFARIKSSGDRALFGGKNTQLMKHQLGVPEGRSLADFLPLVTIKAKDLAATITTTNVEGKNILGPRPIEREHISSNENVREALVKSGITPEELPAEEDAQKLKRKLDREAQESLGFRPAGLLGGMKKPA